VTTQDRVGIEWLVCFRIRLLTRDIEEISRESEKLLMDRYVVMGKFVVSLRSPEYEKRHMLLNTTQ